MDTIKKAKATIQNIERLQLELESLREHIAADIRTARNKKGYTQREIQSKLKAAGIPGSLNRLESRFKGQGHSLETSETVLNFIESLPVKQKIKEKKAWFLITESGEVIPVFDVVHDRNEHYYCKDSQGALIHTTKADLFQKMI